MEHQELSSAVQGAGLKISGRKKKLKISQEKLKKILSYNKDTGIFRWNLNSSKNVEIGDIAGMLNKCGYILIGIDGRTFLAHRLAIIYVHGDCIDDYEVDHINNVRHDNRICNLRLATPSENQFNRGIQRNNTSGIKGVTWSNSRKKWMARCSVRGKNHYLGRYDDVKLAEKAVVEFRRKAHGEFKNNG